MHAARRFGARLALLSASMTLLWKLAPAADATPPRTAAIPAMRSISWREASPVTDEFRSEVRRAAATIPAHVWDPLRQAGWQVHMAEFVTDALPHLAGERPRGWPDGTTWENTEAVHIPKSRLLVVAEKRRGADGAVQRSGRLEGVLRHEVGHAYDKAVGLKGLFASSLPEFDAAYSLDVRAMSPQDRQTLSYYLQEGGAGRQETFAEAFAIVLGGGADTQRRDAFVRSFPRSMRSMRSRLVESGSPSARVAEAPGERK
jgi:hypothetical protein